jgi:hypothetical protein
VHVRKEPEKKTKRSRGCCTDIFYIDPKATFLVFFVVPMPAIAVVGLFAAYDIYKASTLNVN